MMKPDQIFLMGPDFKSGFGRSNDVWRAFLHRLRSDYGITIRGAFYDIA